MSSDRSVIAIEDVLLQASSWALLKLDTESLEHGDMVVFIPERLVTFPSRLTDRFRGIPTDTVLQATHREAQEAGHDGVKEGKAGTKSTHMESFLIRSVSLLSFYMNLAQSRCPFKPGIVIRISGSDAFASIRRILINETSMAPTFVGAKGASPPDEEQAFDPHDQPPPNRGAYNTTDIVRGGTEYVSVQSWETPSS